MGVQRGSTTGAQDTSSDPSCSMNPKPPSTACNNQGMSSDDDSDLDNVGGADAKAIEQYMSEQEREEGEVDDWVDEFMMDMGTKDDTGPAINDNLARLINQLLSGRMAEEKFKDIMKKHVRPENVNMLVNPRVNPQI